MKIPVRNARIAERFLDCAGRPLVPQSLPGRKTRAGARGEKKCRPAPLEMTVLSMAKVRGVVVFVAALSLLTLQASAQVTAERLLNSSKEPQKWLMYSGDYAGHRFGALGQSNVSNAATVVPKWVYQTMAGGKFEATPL